MSSVLEDAPPWWQTLPEAVEPHITDLCHDCGHARDLHVHNGRCGVGHAVVTAFKASEGMSPRINGGEEVFLPRVDLERQECGCGVGDHVWHRLMWPDGVEWDTITKWEDDSNEFHASRVAVGLDATYDSQGNYIWWLRRKTT